MANDASTQIPQSSHEADMGAAHDADYTAVQVAEATPQQQPATPDASVRDGKTVHVQIPQGETVVRVPVQPDDVVILPPPFDSAHEQGMAAKEGNGNLAIKVGDITVILQGYIDAEADPQHPVTIDGSDGQPIDIATVLASTDPNLDIQTAAGPAAGAQGADNGGAIFAALAGGPGLGGFNAVGVLDQTELNYKLIDNSIRQEIELTQTNNPEGPPLVIGVLPPQQQLFQAFLHDPILTHSQMAGHVDFNSFINGFQGSGGEFAGFTNSSADFDGTQAKAGAENEHAVGHILVDPSTSDAVDISLTTTGLAAQHLKSDGVELQYVISDNGDTIFGFRGDGTTTGDGALVLVIHVNAATLTPGTTIQDFPVDFYLVNRLDDPNGGTQQDLNVTFDATSADDRTGNGTITETIVDDNPIAANDSYDVKNNNGITITDVNAGVEHNDKFGADGKIGSVLDKEGSGGVVGLQGGTSDGKGGFTLTSAIGTLHLNADGTFTYDRTNKGPTNGDQTDSFKYSIEDDDGDISTATLTLHINDHGVIIIPPPPPGGGDDPISLNSKGTAVFESALATGSNPASTMETTKGSVHIDAPDGIGSVTIKDGNGVQQTVSVGKIITGAHGDLTITGYDQAKGDITYSYTLKSPESVSGPGNNVDTKGEDFQITATDKDGDASKGDIVIAIVDDVPTAKADADTVNQKAGSTTIGNVITGVGDKDSSLHADTKGADQPAKLTDITNSGGTHGVSDGKGGFDVTGAYGTLHIDQNGNYTYTVGATGMVQGKNDVFNYTITDADGDTSTTTLTIGSSKTPDIIQETPTGHPGEVDVYEAGLSDGSKDGPTDTKASGTFLVDSHGEGFQSLTIGGKSIPLTNGAVSITVSDDATGTLKVTNVADKGNGSYEITYEYDLKDNVIDNTAGQDGHNPVTLPPVAIVATDTSGDQANSSLTVKIVDDVPFAKADSDTVNTAKGSTTAGNVITGVADAGNKDSSLHADTQGADQPGKITDVTNSGGTHGVSDGKGGFDVTGTYGTLHIDANGHYSYTVGAAGIASGKSDVFNYTLTDADGDSSTTTLTIDSSKKPDITQETPTGHPGEVDVYEAGLSDGSKDGPTDTKASGTFLVDSHGEGLTSLTIGGKSVPLTNGPASVTILDDATGTLKVTNVTDKGNGAYEITYEYDLKDNVIDSTAGQDGHNPVSLPPIAIVATDTSGDQANSSLTVKIVDDVPFAKADSDTVNTAKGSTTAGNVITGVADAGNNDSHLKADTQGADQPGKITDITNSGGTHGVSDGKGGFDVTGTYGTLHIDANGHYSYTVGAAGIASGKSDVFNYTLTDADGDSSTTTLTIDSSKKPDITHETPTGHPGEVDVYEAGLSDGSKDGPTATSATGTFLIDSHGEGFQSLTIGGKGIPLTNGAVSITVSDDATGTLKVTNVADKGNGSYEITYEYDLKDNVLDTTVGQDGHNPVTLPSVSIVAIDKSGDEADSSLTVKVVDDIPIAHIDTDTVNVAKGSTTAGNVITGKGDADSHLQSDTSGADRFSAAGDAAGGQAHVANIASSKGGSVVVPGDGSTVSIVGDHGTLKIDDHGNYTYTVGSNPLKQGEKDTFTYTIVDADGDQSTTTLTIDVNCPSIHQDTPGGTPGQVTVYEAGLPDGSKDGGTAVTASGSFTIDSHGEGFNAITVGGVNVSLTGAGLPTTIQSNATGTMVITGVQNDGNGAYTLNYQYTLKDNIIDSTPTSDGHNTVTLPSYQIVATDKSGDQATDVLKVNVVDDIPVVHDANKSISITGGKFNLLITMDLSNSMNDSSGVAKPGGGTYTKLELEKAAIVELLHSYQALGQTSVHIVWFNEPSRGNDGVGSNPGGWLSVQDAIDYIEGRSAQGNTNYDIAINRAEQSFNDLTGYIPNGTNVGYFFSDGMPNENDGPGSDGKDGISGQQQVAWEAFLDANNINSYAIGVGGAAVASELTPIAYNGASNPASDPAGNTIVVTDLNQLSATIQGTVPSGASGNLVGDVSGTYGADGPGHIETVQVNGGSVTTYDVNAASHVVTINLAQGTVKIDMDTGQYTYTPKLGQAQNQVDISFSIKDGDGDISSTKTLHLVPTNHAPVIDSNGGGDTASVTVADHAKFVTNVHALDADAGATVTFSITGGADKSFFTINQTTGALSFINAPSHSTPLDAGGNNVYDVVVTATDNKGATDSQAIAVSVGLGSSLPVAHDETIYTTQSSSASVQDAWLLANDETGTSSNTLAVTGVSNSNDLTASHNSGVVTLTNLFGNINTPGEVASFDYSVSDGKGHSDSAHVTVVYEATSTINHGGDTGDSIVIGSSASENITTGSGNDIIVTGGGTDNVNGGAGFDMVVIGGSSSSSQFKGIEMVNLGDGNHSPSNTVTINAADVLQGTNAANVGGKDVDMLVIGDNEGSSKDTVNLNGFSSQAVATSVTFTDDATHASHTYDLYQATGNSNVVVAVEHDLTVKVTP